MGATLAVIGLGRIGAFHAETLSGLAGVDELVVTDERSEVTADVAERLGARVENRSPGVVLEACERLAGPRALEQDVADHPLLTRDGVQRQQACAGQLDAPQVAVGRTEQLIAAADCEEGSGALDRVAQGLGARGEVGRDELLLAVLAATDVVEVVLAGRDRFSHSQCGHL